MRVIWKITETIPGGKTVSYVTNTMLKLEAGAKLEEDKEYGIKGFYVDMILAKSRTTTAGVRIRLVYEQNTGIDNLLTNLTMLRDRGLVVGRGRWLHLEGFDEVKFSLAEFKDKYKESAKLREVFDEMVKEEMIKLITNRDLFEASNQEDEDIDLIYDEELEVYTDGQGKYYSLDEETNEYVEVEVLVE